MKKTLISAAAASAILLAGAAFAQQAAPPTPAPLAVPSPTYIAIVQEVDVAKPAAAVWRRIGKYCDITEWLGPTCVITSGKDGQLGSVRVLNGATIEIMVAKTDLSYSYTQPVRVGAPYNLYHGTVEVKPVTATTSQIVYSLVLDNSMLADDAARERDRANRATRFMGALRNMKTLAEGGTVTIPPPAAPPAPAPAR
jgi:Polyketide cyclase / dehydrase and lipid transport